MQDLCIESRVIEKSSGDSEHDFRCGRRVVILQQRWRQVIKAQIGRDIVYLREEFPNFELFECLCILFLEFTANEEKVTQQAITLRAYLRRCGWLGGGNWFTVWVILGLSANSTLSLRPKINNWCKRFIAWRLCDSSAKTAKEWWGCQMSN